MATPLQIPGNVAADVAQPLPSPAFFFLWLNVLADFGARWNQLIWVKRQAKSMASNQEKKLLKSVEHQIWPVNSDH